MGKEDEHKEKLSILFWFAIGTHAFIEHFQRDIFDRQIRMNATILQVATVVIYVLGH